MGAGQSTNGSGQTVDGGIILKTSYYTILGIEKSATDDEIKKAYRRKALELHPDRNYGKEDEATAHFAEIQAAYEVLSDPQERSWYDSHEGAILRGDDYGDADDSFHYDIKLTTSKDISHLMGSFYGKKIDYANVPSSFFNVLREFFETLAEEEAKAAKMEGLPIVDYPSFGEKEDTYEEVVKPFYAAWNGFVTEKTYFWEDRHRYFEAPDRRIRRIMEKENKKFRDDAIREFNDSVRTLVAFVRKRDPRYKPNFQTDAERQKELREASAAQAARSRAANAEKLKADVPAWTKTRDAEELEESEDDEIVEEHFECVACRKTFKSEKQFDAHEKSKKHQKAVQSLKRQMQKDNVRLDLGDLGRNSGTITPMSDEEEEDEDVTKDTNKESESEEDEDAAGAVANLKVDDMKSESVDTLSRDEHDSPKTEAAKESASSEDGVDDEYAPRSEVTGRFGALISEPATASEQDSDVSRPETKLGKAAQKRAKRAAKQAAADQEELKFKCAKCNSAFPSRSQLFQHISDFGHAAPVAQSGKTSGKKKGKK